MVAPYQKETSCPYYVGYVNNMLRYYFSHDRDAVPDGTYRTNWDVCDKVLHRLRDNERELIRAVYQSVLNGDGFSEAVQRGAVSVRMQQFRAWKVIRFVTKLIARERGL